ncbi:MAG: cell division protein FtsQ, partial [Mangrovicoccus sp.]
NRRWDVVLDRDQRIMLPEASEILSDSPVAVLERVIAWHEAHELLDRDVSAVDMRNPKRPTLRLGEAAYSYQRTLRAFQNGQKDR